jgi:hypothetical protein
MASSLIRTRLDSRLNEVSLLFLFEQKPSLVIHYVSRLFKDKLCALIVIQLARYVLIE